MSRMCWLIDHTVGLRSWITRIKCLEGAGVEKMPAFLFRRAAAEVFWHLELADERFGLAEPHISFSTGAHER